MQRVEFKQKLIEGLMEKGISPEVSKIKSAMDKTARHATAKYGSVDWALEYGESGVISAMMFYSEYGQKETFNRDGYQRSRSKGDY